METENSSSRAASLFPSGLRWLLERSWLVRRNSGVYQARTLVGTVMSAPDQTRTTGCPSCASLRDECTRLRVAANVFAQDRPRVERDAWNGALDAACEAMLTADQPDIGAAIRALRRSAEPAGERLRTMEG